MHPIAPIAAKPLLNRALKLNFALLLGLFLTSALMMRAADPAKDGRPTATSPWFTDYVKAQQEAKKKKLPLLCLMTNSHSCYFCIKLEKGVFSKPEFTAFANKELVLFKLDYAPCFTNKNANRGEEMSRLKKAAKIPADFKETGGWPSITVFSPNGKILHSEREKDSADLDVFIKKYQEIIQSGSAAKPAKK